MIENDTKYTDVRSTITRTSENETNTNRNKGRSLMELPDDYIIVDLETTGYSSNYSEIIEVALIKIRNNEIVDRFQSLVKPVRKINDYIIELTGITNELLDDAPSISQVTKLAREFIGEDILMAHNANFDINFLYDSFLKHLNIELRNDFVDTLRISRRAFSDYPKHTLSYLCENIPIAQRSIHRAMSDCLVTFDLYNTCKNKIIFEKIKLYNASGRSYIDLKNISAHDEKKINEESPLYGNECVFTGTLSEMTRSEAMQYVVNIGGAINNGITRNTKYLIMGAQDYSKFADGKESSKTKKIKSLIASGQNIHIISEDDFYKIIFDMEK